MKKHRLHEWFFYGWNTHHNNYMNDFSPLYELSHGLEPGALCGPEDLITIIKYFTSILVKKHWLHEWPSMEVSCSWNSYHIDYMNDFLLYGLFSVFTYYSYGWNTHHSLYISLVIYQELTRKCRSNARSAVKSLIYSHSIPLAKARVETLWRHCNLNHPEVVSTHGRTWRHCFCDVF